MDNIASYNSDIDGLKQNIEKNDKLMSELNDKKMIEKVKSYEGIQTELGNLLYREKIIFGVTSFIAISITIITFKNL